MFGARHYRLRLNLLLAEEVNEMGKFEKTFNEPVSFSDGTLILSREYSAEDAAELFSSHYGEDISASELSEDRVRFGFPPEFVEGGADLGGCWYTGAGYGKGTKAVWVY